MTYFVDFDRTIFDTPSFKRDFKFPFRFMFSPDQLTKYLYLDVPPFLAKHGQETIVVTYGIEAFIVAKVTSALANTNLQQIVYTAHKKGRTIKRLCEQEEGPYTFVDDAHFQLESVQKWCPNVSLFEMRRDGKPGDGRWKVIRSLDEVAEVLD